jgi:hypothetical protein
MLARQVLYHVSHSASPQRTFLRLLIPIAKSHITWRFPTSTFSPLWSAFFYLCQSLPSSQKTQKTLIKSAALILLFLHLRFQWPPWHWGPRSRLLGMTHRAPGTLSLIPDAFSTFVFCCFPSNPGNLNHLEFLYSASWPIPWCLCIYMSFYFQFKNSLDFVHTTWLEPKPPSLALTLYMALSH